MARNWLLVERFGDQEPAVIGRADRAASMIPLHKVLSPRNRDAALRALDAAAARGPERYIEHTPTMQIIVDPLFSFRGICNGAWLWVGPLTEDPPDHVLAGAWYFDLTSSEIAGSHELLDIYRQPRDQRQTKRALAEAFTRLSVDPKASEAFALIVNAPVGQAHQATWTIECDDGALRAGHWSCRSVEEDEHVVLRGITHDLGPAEEVAEAPPPAVLERRVLDAVARPGTYRALLNIKTNRIMRWMDDPPEQLAWTDLENDLIHPQDQPQLTALHANIAHGQAETSLRLKGLHEDEWIPCEVLAYPVLLDTNTTAALWEIKPTL